MLLWMKENAVAITAIIAAVGTLGGVAVKITKGAEKAWRRCERQISF